MTEAEKEAHDEKWSHDNKGQHYGWYPALPYHACFPDMLHMNLNQFNSATEEAYHSHLLDEAYDDPGLKQLAAGVREKVNTRLKAHAEQGGAGVLLTFGLPGKLHVANGPKMKAVLRHPTLLLDLCELMRPLWAAAEARDEPAVRRKPMSKEELERETARNTAADLTAAAGAAEPEHGNAGVAARAKKAAKKAKQAAGLRRGAARPVVLPSETARAQNAAPALDADSTEDATEEEVNELHANLDAAGLSVSDTLEKYEERVAWMFVVMQQHFIYTRQHELASSGIDQDYRKARAMEAHRLGLEVERAMLCVIGTKRRRTYGHDIVYGLPGLYMLLGKPYLGACEGNEHAHQEMKYMFRHMSSKNSKTRSACLQTLDLMVVKRLLIEKNAAFLPRTKYTGMRTGLSMEAGHKRKAPKCSDDTVEESKENLMKIVPSVENPSIDAKLLDPETVAKLAKRAKHTQGGGEGEGGDAGGAGE